MLRAEGKKIIMDEYNYGLSLPIKINGDILKTDKIIFSIKKYIQGEDIIKKIYTGDDFTEENGKLVFDLTFSKEEAEKLPLNRYFYIVQQCRNCKVHNTLINEGIFEVEKGCEVCTASK